MIVLYKMVVQDWTVVTGLVEVAVAVDDQTFVVVSLVPERPVFVCLLPFLCVPFMFQAKNGAEK